MRELRTSRWRKGGVAGVGKEHAMAAQSVIPRETKSTRDKDCTTYPMNHDSGNNEQTNMTSLWYCEPVAIARLWLLFTIFIASELHGRFFQVYMYTQNFYHTKQNENLNFVFPPITCLLLAKKTYLLLSGPLWEIFWFHPYSDHDLYNTCLVLLWSGLACT